MKDQELQLMLASYLQNKIEIYEQQHGLDPRWCFFWKDGMGRQIADESWLHVCWLIEQKMPDEVYGHMMDYLAEAMVTKKCQCPRMTSASWQQRARAIERAMETET